MTYYNLGIVYSDMGNIQKAIDSLKKAIELNPNLAQAYNNLSILYLRQNEYDLAVQYFNKAEKLGFVDTDLKEALKPYLQEINENK